MVRYDQDIRTVIKVIPTKALIESKKTMIAKITQKVIYT